ncbi:MAG TPA: hypothetical protein VFB27_05180 [Opitutaceae bacterium]|nr:hypothetical protein [Opitutaceae bacterium]
MESPDLNPFGDDRLDALLRTPPAAPLADDGFSARVLAALPPQKKRRQSWIRICVLTTAALAGLAVALWQKDGGTDLLAQSDHAVTALYDHLSDPSLLVALLATAVTLFFATTEDDPPALQLE